MNNIHETAIIRGNVKIGKGNTIGAYTVIEGPIEIGDNNFISSHVVLGCSATDTKKIAPFGQNPMVKIGNNNIIREFCIVEQPCYEEFTVIGNNTFLMQGVHISHDACISDKVVITNTSVIAGIVKILEGANVAMGCTINQYVTIGQYCIVATGAACMKNVKPFSRYIPGKPISVNNYAIKKFGFEEYESEICDYVLKDIPANSEVIKEIIRQFENSVDHYGVKTY